MASVTVILRGGLGNQMFEYAAGLGRALDNKTRLVVDTTYLNDRFPRPQMTYRNYDLDVFKVEPEFTRFSKISSQFRIPGVWLGLDFLWHGAKKIVSGGRNEVLWGFYQGEKYFAGHKDAIRDAFHFRNELARSAAKLAEEIKQTNSVSLHVRRGDYLLPNNVALFGATDIDYYARAAAYIADHVPMPHFYFFSDDIAWCREHIKLSFPVTYVDETSRGPKDAFHLQLISLCKHNIIANSSFSWWGAWLNHNPDKIVVAPEWWSQTERSNREGFLPSSWLVM